MRLKYMEIKERDEQILKLKKNISNEISAAMENIIDIMIKWGKDKGKRETEERKENIEYTNFEKACLRADADMALRDIIANAVDKAAEIGIKEGIEEYEADLKIFENIMAPKLIEFEKKIYTCKNRDVVEPLFKELLKTFDSCKSALHDDWDDLRLLTETNNLKDSLGLKLSDFYLKYKYEGK